MAEEQSTESERGDDVFDPVDSLSLDEALSIIGEETRARIIVELGESVQSDGVSIRPLSFSELMDAVGVSDSGRFNYHLDKLVDTFVKKTGQGYVLRPPGHFLYRAIVAGTLTDREGLDSFTVDDCPDCGATLTVEYPSDHCLYVRCRKCETLVQSTHLPNRGIEGRSREEILDAAVRKDRHETGILREGVCPGCSARVDRDLRAEDPAFCGEVCDYEVYALLTCSACNVGGVAHPASVALTTPAAVGFFAGHGRDPRAIRPWAEPVVEARFRSQIVTEDPLVVEVPFELEGEQLTVRLDEDLQVSGTERSSA